MEYAVELRQKKGFGILLVIQNALFTLEDELLVLSKTFEDSNDWESAKLVGIHNEDIIDILKSLSLFPHHVGDYERIISEGLHETNAVDKG